MTQQIFNFSKIFIFNYVSGYYDGHLIVYSKNHINVFNTETAEWVQTLNIKQSIPLDADGSLILCSLLNDITVIIHLCNIHRGK